jgi:hypothetical protein
MKRWLLGAAFFTACFAQAQDGAKSYEHFKLLRTRNIFDPDRRPAPTRSEAPSPSAESRSAGVALTGTMVTEGRALAFFGSARAEYNKVATTRDVIADFTVTKISPGLVELEKGGKPVMITVGQSLPIEGAEPFNAANAPTAPATIASPAAAPGSAPAPAGDKSEVLRRMMERRQKENPQ